MNEAEYNAMIADAERVGREVGEKIRAMLEPLTEREREAALGVVEEVCCLYCGSWTTCCYCRCDE